MKIRKSFVLMLSLVTMAILLTGCGAKETKQYANSDGTPITYTEENIPEGMFVLKEKKYNALLNLGEETMSNPLYVWYTGYDKAIPVLEKGDKLILYSTTTIPPELQFVKMNDFGYTVGLRFQKDPGGAGLIFPKNDQSYNPTSPVKKYMLETVLKDSKGVSASIKEVNGKEFKETMLSVDGFMKGLTKDAMYKFYYYQGTVYKDVNIKADTHVFLKDFYLPSSSYEQLKEKTFIVNLPASISDGYWLIEGFGMFRYIGEEKSVIQDNTDEQNNDKTEIEENTDEIDDKEEIDDVDNRDDNEVKEDENEDTKDSSSEDDNKEIEEDTEDDEYE